MNCTSNRGLDFSCKYSVKRNAFCLKPHWPALSSLHQRKLIYVENTYLEWKAHLITFLINSFIFHRKEAFLQAWNVYRLNLHRKGKEDPAHLGLSLNSFQSQTWRELSDSDSSWLYSLVGKSWFPLLAVPAYSPRAQRRCVSIYRVLQVPDNYVSCLSWILLWKSSVHKWECWNSGISTGRFCAPPQIFCLSFPLQLVLQDPHKSEGEWCFLIFL